MCEESILEQEFDQGLSDSKPALPLFRTLPSPSPNPKQPLLTDVRQTLRTNLLYRCLSKFKELLPKPEVSEQCPWQFYYPHLRALI